MYRVALLHDSLLEYWTSAPQKRALPGRSVLMLFRGVTFPPEWSNLVYLVIVVSTVAIAHTFHVLVETPANIWLRDRLITAPRKVAVS